MSLFSPFSPVSISFFGVAAAMNFMCVRAKEGDA
jgi:hypothetical protein